MDETSFVDTDWDEVAGSLPWLEDLVEVPEDATPPRFMTGAHPDAVGSYGQEFLDWADATPGLHPKRTGGMRWFQRVLAMRLLEHDIEGRLVWRNVLITLSRQTGKSWFIRSLITWRIQQRKRFGDEPQAVVHMAHKLIAAQEIWTPAKNWATTVGWGVRIANGEQQIESPDEGRWLVRAASDGVGASFSLSMIVADEAWKIRRDVVESADAAMTEAVSPQLLLVSTAGDSASDLFGTYRSVALDELTAPGNTLLVEWSTPRHMPRDDPASWRLASPHWTPAREREVADKLKKLEPGEFSMNFLNWWLPTVVNVKEDPAHPAFTAEELEACNGTAPGPPVVAAVEDNFGEGLAVCLASVAPTGEARVSVQLVDSSAQAAAVLVAHRSTLREIVVGKSMLHDPAFKHRFKMTDVMMNGRHTVAELRRLLADGAIRHDGSEALIEQALGIQVVEGAEGPRIRSDGALHAVKATVWAAKAVRALPPAAKIF